MRRSGIFSTVDGLAPHHRRGDRGGCHAVHLHARRTAPLRQPFDQRVQPALAGGVMRAGDQAARLARERADEDHAPAASRRHARHEGPGTVDRTLEVHVEHAVRAPRPTPRPASRRRGRWRPRRRARRPARAGPPGLRPPHGRARRAARTPWRPPLPGSVRCRPRPPRRRGRCRPRPSRPRCPRRHR